MKRALIVDDSRLARTVLSRLLEEHGVATDTAESAEVALDYLKHSRPDVVFLDHNMPGIDGFEALEAIKKNPATATIPVMMYTSEEGELYVGQARALGALGVLPKTVEPVEVAKVLRTLRLIPGAPSAAPAAGPPSADRPSRPAASIETASGADRAPSAPDPDRATGGPAPPPAPVDQEWLRELLDELLSAQAAGLRDELRREIRRLSPAAPPVLPRRRLVPRARALALASAALLVVCAVLGYLYWVTSASLEEANARARRVLAETAKLDDGRASTLESVAAPAVAPSDVLGVLEWGVNQGGRYAFGAVPLDDARATVFAGLFDQLGRLGFAGTVAIEVHTGRFCMDYGRNDALELAPPDQSAATCEQIGWPEIEAVALGKHQSLAFANAVASAAARYPRLKIESASRGSIEPAVDYPASGLELTAGTWNAVAAANQRVAVKILPEVAVPVTGARR